MLSYVFLPEGNGDFHFKLKWESHDRSHLGLLDLKGNKFPFILEIDGEYYKGYDIDSSINHINFKKLF